MAWLGSQHSVCLYKNLTGHDCYGCGMTRAIVSAIHLHFREAYYFNKLFVVVLPLLIYIWGKMLVNMWNSDGTEHGAQGSGQI